MQEKFFDKIQHLLINKNSQKVYVERTYLNIVKAICDKLTANVTLNGEKLKMFPLKSRTRQGCPLLSFTFVIVLQVLVTAVREEKKIKELILERKK